MAKTFEQFTDNDFDAFVQEHVSLIDSVLVDLNNLEPQLHQPCYRTNTWSPAISDQQGSSSLASVAEAPSSEENSGIDMLSSDNNSDVEMVDTAATFRNAWGNNSYAELIEQAIRSAPQSRLTLAGIYSWFTSNIDYFRERADASQSTSWKVSTSYSVLLLVNPTLCAKGSSKLRAVRRLWRIFDHSRKRLQFKLRFEDSFGNNNHIFVRPLTIQAQK